MVIAGIGVVSAAVMMAVIRNAPADQTADHRAVKASPPSQKAAVDDSLNGPASEARPSNSVTITGCLERDAEKFRLKDTAGDNAPRARSRKSGFLEQGSTAGPLSE